MSQEMVPEESVRVQNRSMREYGHLAARFATGWSTLATGSVSIYNFSEATAYRLAGEVSEGQQYLSESSNFAFLAGAAGMGYLATRIIERRDIQEGKLPVRPFDRGRRLVKSLGAMTIGTAAASAGLIREHVVNNFNDIGYLLPTEFVLGALTVRLGYETMTAYSVNKSRNLPFAQLSTAGSTQNVPEQMHQRPISEDQVTSISEQNPNESPVTDIIRTKKVLTPIKKSSPSSRRERKNKQNIGWGTRLADKIGLMKTKADSEKLLEQMKLEYDHRTAEYNERLSSGNDGTIITYDSGVVYDLNPFDGKPPITEAPGTPPMLNDVTNND